MTDKEHWSTVYLKKHRKTVSVSRMDMLLVLWTKYELSEINFLELKDRVRAVNVLSEWVEGFTVMESAFLRFKFGGVTTPGINSQFLRHFKNKKFQEIDQYGVEDFPKHTNEKGKNESKTDL